MYQGRPKAPAELDLQTSHVCALRCVPATLAGPLTEHWVLCVILRWPLLFFYMVVSLRASLVAQTVKNLPAPWGTQVWSLGQEDPWRRKWHPVFLHGKAHGQRSLVGYSPWGRKKSDTAERLTLKLLFFTSLRLALLSYLFTVYPLCLYSSSSLF